jgi:hypothetical protein
MDGRTQGAQERISASSELGSEHGDCGWRVLQEQNGIETSNGGFDSFKKNEILMSHHGCATNWYQSTATTLGLLGLMHESYEIIS